MILEVVAGCQCGAIDCKFAPIQLVLTISLHPLPPTPKPIEFLSYGRDPVKALGCHSRLFIEKAPGGWKLEIDLSPLNAIVSQRVQDEDGSFCSGYEEDFFLGSLENSKISHNIWLEKTPSQVLLPFTSFNSSS